MSNAVKVANKVKMVCGTCGSEDIHQDASVVWNVEDQEWKISSRFFDEGQCNKCECECLIVESSIRD